MTCALLNQVEEREEQDPHHVNKVPVDGCCLNHIVVLRRELAESAAVEADGQHQHAAKDVCAVEAGEDVEGATEHAVCNPKAELRVVIRLAHQEDHAEKHSHK